MLTPSLCVCAVCVATQAQLKMLKEQIAEADGEIMELKQGGGAPLDGYGEPARPPSTPLDGDDSSVSDPARGKRFIATKKLAVRSGIEANTRKVGTIAPGELVIGLEQQISTEGALRVRSVKGWVTATSLSGVPLLRLALDGEGTPGSPRADALPGSASPPPLALGAALKLPTKSELIELTRLKKPPATVANVCGAVRVVLEGKDTARNNGGKGNGWALTVSLLKNYNSTLNQMKAVDPTGLSAAVGRRLAKLINDPEFDPDRIAKVCGAVVGMAKWLVGVYQLMRAPNGALSTSVDDVDAESQEVTLSTRVLAVPSATVTRKSSGGGTKTGGGGAKKSPSKKFFDRLSSTSASGRPLSARAVPSQQRPRPRSAPRPHSARAAPTRKQQSKAVGGSRSGAGGRKAGTKRSAGRPAAVADESTARTNVSMEDLMRIRDAAGFEMEDGGREETETIDLAQAYDDHHYHGRSMGMTDEMMHRGGEDAHGNGHVAEPSVSVISGGGGGFTGGEADGSFGSDGGGAVSAGDFLPRQAPPASQGAGLRQWYDIEIGAVQLQARKLREQLDMAEHAISLLVAARERDTAGGQ